MLFEYCAVVTLSKRVFDQGFTHQNIRVKSNNIPAEYSPEPLV